MVEFSLDPEMHHGIFDLIPVCGLRLWKIWWSQGIGERMIAPLPGYVKCSSAGIELESVLSGAHSKEFY